MSTASSAARSPVTSVRPSAGASPQPRLRSVPRRRPRAPRGVFVLLVVALLVGGLMTLLALNTALAQDSFVVSDLQKQQSQLADQEQQLTQQVAILQSPVALAARARQLGMVPGGRPTFLAVGSLAAGHIAQGRTR